MVVVRQHLPFQTADTVGKAVGIEAGHRDHRQQITGCAVSDDDGARFEADSARRVVLKIGVDAEAHRLAGNILARLEIAHDAARCGHFDAAGAGRAAQVLLVDLFQRILAHLVAGRDEQRIVVLLVLFGRGRADVADEVADGRSGGIETRIAALGDDAGQIGQAHGNGGELVPVEPGGDFDGREAVRLVELVLQVLQVNRRQVEQLAQRLEGVGGIGQALGIRSTRKSARFEASGMPLRSRIQPRRGGISVRFTRLLSA